MDYKYKDQHFSVEIAEALLAETWTSGNKIRTIRRYLLRKHKEYGGLEPHEGRSGSVIVIRALDNLQKKAKTSCIGNNVWRIAKEDQWIFGEGAHWVYLYYFSKDKEEAESKGASVWECKIGSAGGFTRTGNLKRDAPEKRVKRQTSGTPVPPRIALLLRTDLHTTLETVIQGTLTLQGKHLPQAQGKEWFLTNPSEVVRIVAMIDFGLLSPVLNLSPILENFERNVK